eukprot:6470684-Alexandrium_andersonii.AAC.1
MQPRTRGCWMCWAKRPPALARRAWVAWSPRTNCSQCASPPAAQQEVISERARVHADGPEL